VKGRRVVVKWNNKASPGVSISRWRATVLGCVPPAVGGLSTYPGAGAVSLFGRDLPLRPWRSLNPHRQ
jgi:hypothetical protein